MNRWWTLALGAALLGIGWVADRLLIQAAIHQGTLAGSEGSQALLLVADRLPKLVLLAGLGGMLIAAAWRGMDRASAVLLAAVGGALALMPLVAFGLRVEPLWPLAREFVFPAQFVSWASVGLLLIGTIALRWGPQARGSPSIHPWVRVVAAVALLVAVIPLDARLEDAYLAAAANGAITAMIGWDIAARLLVLGVLAIALRSALSGPRHRVAGGTIAVVAFVPFIGLAILGIFAPQPMGSIGADDGVPVAGYAMRWLSGGLALIGAWELLAPASAAVETVEVHARPIGDVA